jgi:hypothetical protein
MNFPQSNFTMGKKFELQELSLSVKMMDMNIATVISEVGLTRIAKACNRSPATVHKWKSRNRLPRTEWTGETNYAETIARLHGGISAESLLSFKDAKRQA